jgi:HlyD family secretion protein
VTEREFELAQYELDMAQAATASAQVALDRARNNLAYTFIHAPIGGVVVERNVDAGQTVAASLQAPQLFLIAGDLGHLQILAAVDESDIGLIRPELPVRFTVQAYPGRRFSGEVLQVRLQSVTRDNVVTYTVVVDVENPDGRLLPGMTATVSFVTGAASDVLLVPNAALRFRPTEAMLADAGVESAPPSAPALWHQHEDGRLAMIPVRTGLTDEQRTEVSGEGLMAGMQVLVGAVQTGGRGGLLSPFQPTGQTGPARPGF